MIGLYLLGPDEYHYSLFLMIPELCPFYKKSLVSQMSKIIPTLFHMKAF